MKVGRKIILRSANHKIRHYITVVENATLQWNQVTKRSIQKDNTTNTN